MREFHESVFPYFLFSMLATRFHWFLWGNFLDISCEGSCKNFSIFLFMFSAYSYSPGSYESTGTKVFKKFDEKAGKKEFCSYILYKRYLEKPLKAFEGGLFHVSAYAFSPEMPQNRIHSFSVLFSFSNRSRVFFSKCLTCFCSFFLKCTIFPIFRIR